jgi:FkbM family methyltransferase
MRALASKYKAAVRALGLRTGLGFATQQVFGKRREIALTIRGGDDRRQVWLRSGSTDLAIFAQIFVQRDYDFSAWSPYANHIGAQYKAILAAGSSPLIIDAGANAGYSAIWFAREYPRARVVAIEPDPANFALLQRNVAPFPNIVPVEAALWNEPATLSVVDQNDWDWGRRFDVGLDGPGIPSVTVNELLQQYESCVPFVAKIDIEGAETKLLRSNDQWADIFPLVIFEPHDSLYHWLGAWQGSAHSFFASLSRRKREYLVKGENVFAFLHPDGKTKAQ